jgi:hypothetical protein
MNGSSILLVKGFDIMEMVKKVLVNLYELIAEEFVSISGIFFAVIIIANLINGHFIGALMMLFLSRVWNRYRLENGEINDEYIYWHKND